ncbi:hypothetical protein BO70DRAFT_67965 [Aspergillus heteromorphus CBS 117.55]|uniref:Uncharacterized protein n=1 Tax=Aspergillus heteromorphus CBS 117.55 TaxID=1448321 RepID=A0A317W029_9EURO|nr:uncharacterized protein BO70DRAFT_67965 [Aspergillus heteromorphus CBS 117.55]PWY77500.1 hypothetical protein BO70DRAFT_67965 [Aspergillus heteromorphus CBS 117.55]
MNLPPNPTEYLWPLSVVLPLARDSPHRLVLLLVAFFPARVLPAWLSSPFRGGVLPLLTVGGAFYLPLAKCLVASNLTGLSRSSSSPEGRWTVDGIYHKKFTAGMHVSIEHPSPNRAARGSTHLLFARNEARLLTWFPLSRAW